MSYDGRYAEGEEEPPERLLDDEEYLFFLWQEEELAMPIAHSLCECSPCLAGEPAFHRAAHDLDMLRV